MADYFKHWLAVGKSAESIGGANALPKIFTVNFFAKNRGKFLWPGFGDNIRFVDKAFFSKNFLKRDV